MLSSTKAIWRRTAAWAAADGSATEQQLALLEEDPRAWRWALEDLLEDHEDRLEVVRFVLFSEGVLAEFTRALGRGFGAVTPDA